MSPLHIRPIARRRFVQGLAIGGAFAAGSAGLGTFLVLGFALHNVTEGIGIAAPMLRFRPPLWTFPALTLLAGGPAVCGGAEFVVAGGAAAAAQHGGAAKATAAQVEQRRQYFRAHFEALKSKPEKETSTGRSRSHW